MARRRFAQLARTGALTTMLCLGLPSGAAADQAPPETKAVRKAREAARPLARDGYIAFDRGDYPEALRLFREAEATFHAPPHNLFIARALHKLGRKLEAHAVYRDTVEEQLASYAPVAFLEAQAKAREEMAALEGDLSAITFQVNAPDAELAVDGKAAQGSRVFVLPGEHEVVASVDWAPPEKRMLTLTAGQRETVVVSFPPRPPAPSGEPEHAYLIPALSTLGVGATALVVGTVTGVVHLGQVDAIRERCEGNRCPPDQEGPADDSRPLGHVSTAMFVIGGLAVATGATLLIIGWPEEEDVGAELHITPGGLRIQGRF